MWEGDEHEKRSNAAKSRTITTTHQSIYNQTVLQGVTVVQTKVAAARLGL